MVSNTKPIAVGLMMLTRAIACAFTREPIESQPENIRILGADFLCEQARFL